MIIFLNMQMDIEQSKNDSNDSKDDNRIELPWEEREEKLVQKIATECKTLTVRHEKKAKQNKKMYVACGLPAMIIPIILAGVNSFLKQEHEIMVSCLLIFSGILTGISQFFNFGKKTQAHFEFAGRYAELLLTIEIEMVKPKRFRLACDVFLERVSKSYADLNNNAPVL